MPYLPLVEEALADSMPGCRLTELLRERWIFQQDPSALAKMVEAMGKRAEVEAWMGEQPEFKEWLRIKNAKVVRSERPILEPEQPNLGNSCYDDF